jgi:hypothetical protein
MLIPGATAVPRLRRQLSGNDAAQQRQFETMAAHQALSGMSDRPGGQSRQDPWQALINQTRRARSNEEDGLQYLTMPF